MTTHGGRAVEQSSQRAHGSSSGRTASAAARAAAAFDRCTCAPASARRAAWRSKPCGSAGVPVSETTTASRARAAPARTRWPARARRPGRGARRGPSTTSSRIAPDARVGRLDGEPLVAQRRVDHRVGAAPGERVVTEVDHRVVGAGVPASGAADVERELGRQRDVRPDRAEQLAGDEHRLVAQGAAAEQAAQRRGRASAAAPAPTTATGGVRPPSALDDPLGGRGQVGPAGAERGPLDGEPAARRPGCSSALTTSGSAGLLTTTTSSVPASSASAARAWRADRPPTAADRSRPPRPRQCRTPTPPCAEQRHELLRAGAGGGDERDGSGLDDVGEAQPDAADDRGAAVRAHDQHVLRRAPRP